MLQIQKYLQIDHAAPLPVTAQIKQQIAWLIVSGKLQAGNRLPPIRELADQLGVHMHTVRFAYQRLEMEGLVRIRRGQGTVVLDDTLKNRIDSPEGKLQSNTIGVLIPGLNPFFLPLLRGIEDASREIPALIFVSNIFDNPLMAETTIHQMIEKNVDGLILVSSGFEWFDANRYRTPVVFVDEPNACTNVIQFDSEGSGYQSTKHLLDHGHECIALITAPLAWPQAQTVFQGYLRALDEASLTVDNEIIVEAQNFSTSGGYWAMKQLLKNKKIQAVFAIADTLAIGALRAIKAHGLQVPEDIVLAGCNDIEFSDMLDPSLTTVSFPTYQAGLQAVESLQVLRSEGISSSLKSLLETTLVIRQSCGCGQ
jgi:DNA-binding LacI/PurR family transcriptional regulator